MLVSSAVGAMTTDNTPVYKETPLRIWSPEGVIAAAYPLMGVSFGLLLTSAICGPFLMVPTRDQFKA